MLHLKLLGRLGHAVVDVRSGASTTKCGLPRWRPHSVVWDMSIINGRADVDVASAAVRSERSVCLALCRGGWRPYSCSSSSIIGETVAQTSRPGN